MLKPSQKWVKVTEVAKKDIADYLCQMREKHYQIVAVEQTSSSKCLSKFKFPSKTILLLGNEKEGIPVELIKAVDYCIEIPQTGVIRSLNVHVTGKC